MEQFEHLWPGWEIVEKIGEGSYGKVYKIKNNQDGFVKYSALKVIEFPQSEAEIRELLNTGMDYQSIRAYYEDIRKKLVGEIRVMEALKTGANIVVIEDYKYMEHSENVGWTIYIRMELLESLNVYLQREKEISEREVLKIGEDICQALECCEKNHVIHRDIKPDNIFRNEYGNYKLGDFGIAKQMEMTKSVYSQKGTGMYMAPEVYRGESYNKTVDIYALGIMLYRLLNHGRFPFMPPYPKPIRPSDTEEALRKRMNGEEMLPPIQADKKLAEIIAKAIAFQSTDRYQNASELREALVKAEYDLYIKKPDIVKRQKESGEKSIKTFQESYQTEKTWNAWREEQAEIDKNQVVTQQTEDTEIIRKEEPGRNTTPKVAEQKQSEKDEIVFHWEQGETHSEIEKGDKITQQKTVKLARGTMNKVLNAFLIFFGVWFCLVIIYLFSITDEKKIDDYENQYEDGKIEESEYANVLRDLSETGEIYEKELEAGTYIVGVHIPEGRYKAQLVGEYGTLELHDEENRISILEFMKKENDIIEIEDIRCYNGAVLHVSEDDSMVIRSENAQVSAMTGIPNPLTESVTVKDGQVVGEDFPAGMYDIVMPEGGNENFYFAYIVPGTVEEDSVRRHDDATDYNTIWEVEPEIKRNIYLPEGTELMMEPVGDEGVSTEDMTVTLVPSETVPESYEGYHIEDFYR